MPIQKNTTSSNKKATRPYNNCYYQKYKMSRMENNSTFKIVMLKMSSLRVQTFPSLGIGWDPSSPRKLSICTYAKIANRVDE